MGSFSALLLTGLLLGDGPVPAAPRGRRGVARPTPKKGSPRWKRLVRPPSRPRAASLPGRPAAPVINFVNLHTGERLAIYASAVPAPALVNRFLRCRWTQRVARMDQQPIRWVVEAARHFGVSEVHVISGFRHPKFNEVLRKKGRQVARRSNHRLGKALDFRLLGVEVPTVFRYLKRRRLGGIGRYPNSKFIHLDTGRFRTWGGH